MWDEDGEQAGWRIEIEKKNFMGWECSKYVKMYLHWEKKKNQQKITLRGCSTQPSNRMNNTHSNNQELSS